MKRTNLLNTNLLLSFFSQKQTPQGPWFILRLNGGLLKFKTNVINNIESRTVLIENTSEYFTYLCDTYGNLSEICAKLHKVSDISSL